MRKHLLIAIALAALGCSDDDTCKDIKCNPSGREFSRCEYCISASSSDPSCTLEGKGDGEDFSCTYDPDDAASKTTCDDDLLAWQNAYCAQ